MGGIAACGGGGSGTSDGVDTGTTTGVDTSTTAGVDTSTTAGVDTGTTTGVDTGTDTDEPTDDELIALIERVVGSVEHLTFPDELDELPLPLGTDGTLDTTFELSQEKIDLGRFLFGDPALTTHVVTREENAACSGNLALLQGGSCIACHAPAAGGGKAGQEIGISVGGEGLFYTNELGQTIFRRRMIPGLQDFAPTLVQQTDADGTVVNDGNCDETDIVGRNPPQITVAGYNNRLLLDGLAGQPADAEVNANPDDLPAILNIAQALRVVHRMDGDSPIAIPGADRGQSQSLREIEAYRVLFERAYPELAGGPIEDLINAETIFRATAAFMVASTIPRNAPFQRFLRGEEDALSPQQRRGAILFYTPASEGGAGCVACHSGPSMNKQLGDQDFSLVEENFVNVGVRPNHIIAEQLTGTALGEPNRQDRGRGGVTGNAADDFEFRTPTVLQLCGGTHFMHSASMTSVREVVEYFNAGIPQSDISGPTADPRFTHPRGEGSPAGLGLSPGDVDDLTEFMLGALCDPGLVTPDPNSTTGSMTPRLDYSAYDEELGNLPGVVDGMMPSGLPFGSNDALTRRDHGLEFADVTASIGVGTPASQSTNGGAGQQDLVGIDNTSADVIDTHLIVIVDGLPAGASLVDAEGTTADGLPYVRVFLRGGVLLPGNGMPITLRFVRAAVDQEITGYTLGFLSGQGDPSQFLSDGTPG